MPAYSDRIHHLAVPELGDDIWVDVRNPLLLPMEPDDWDSMSDGDRSRARYARWISAWSVLDPETDAPLPSPPSANDIRRAPRGVLNRVLQEVAEWGNPLPPTTGSSNTSSMSSNPEARSSTASGPETTSPPSSATTS